MPSENVIETDVLVIGGGMAGCFAAIKAVEQGLKVALVDKGYVSKSGQTPWAGAFAVFYPEWGHSLDEWMNQVNTVGEYINNQEWTEIVFQDSYARYQDLVSWGVEFLKEDGKLCISPSPVGVSEVVHLEPRKFPQVLRKQAVKSGVRIMDRIMVTDLLKRDEKIVGAVGIGIESYDLYIFKAKATVLSVGACGFKPAGWPISELTADGEAMAYRVGAEITGKEFVDTHGTSADYPAAHTHGMPPMGHKGPPRHRLVNAEGNEVPGRGTLFLEMEFEAHAGRAPVFMDIGDGRKVPRVGGAAAGMSVHKAEGIWPANERCATSLPGLYAAGDTLGTMQVGAVYSGIGFALAGSSVTGARAGLGAAEYALQSEEPVVDKEELARLKNVVYAPIERRGGFSPGWVTQVLQNTMIPYFILYVKHGERMQAALTIVEFLKNHLVPKLTAKDPHELRLAHETKNMVLNAEMKLRASIFRTESRGCHYREDYPRRDDPAWLAWVILKEERGRMKALKKPIPKEWWPDLSKPYEERYPFRFPGE